MTTLWDGSGDDVWDDGEPWNEDEAAKRRAARADEQAERAAIQTEPATKPVAPPKVATLPVQLTKRPGSTFTWPPPERQWVSEFFAIAPGRPTMLCAQPGVGKGWLAQMIQWSVCGGLPLGDIGQVGVKGPTLWLDYEEGEDELWRRHARVRAGYEPIRDPFDHNILYEDCTLTRNVKNFGNPGFVKTLETELLGIKLCVVDNLAECYADKNHNPDKPNAAEPIRIMTQLSLLTGCAFLVIFHPRKSPGGDSDRVEDDASLLDQIRGSGAIPGALGSAWVGKTTKDKRTLWRHAKCNGQQKSPPFIMHWEDHKDRSLTLHAELAPEPKPIDVEGDPREIKRARDGAAMQASILEFIRKSPRPVSMASIEAHVDGDDKRVRRTVVLLRDSGAIEEMAGPKNARLFSSCSVEPFTE